MYMESEKKEMNKFYVSRDVTSEGDVNKHKLDLNLSHVINVVLLYTIYREQNCFIFL